MTDRIKAIIQQINVDNEEQLARALDLAGAIPDLKDDEKAALAAAFSTLFYHDLSGRTAIIKLANRAEKFISKLGPAVLSEMIAEITQADSESAAHFGRVIARNGRAAVKPLMEAIDTNRKDDYAVMNLITAFSYFRDAEVVKALPEILVAAKSANQRLRSEAIYAIGRIANANGANLFDDTLRIKMFDTPFQALKDKVALVRRNAARSLGKMLRKGILNPAQEAKLYEAFQGILGYGTNNWDNAYIVRHEAERALPYFRKDGDGKNRYYQSFRILEKRELCPDTFYYTIQAPFISRKLKAGQFIIIRPSEFSERIPLSICGWDATKGTINIIIMSAGRTSREINNMSVGDCIADIVGPLGTRSHVKKHEGTCVVIGGGYGTGAVIPTARDLKALGNRVIGIVGARNEKLLIMVDELAAICDEVMVTTNDGSKGITGFVTHALDAILARGEKLSHVLAVGPVPMMMAVAAKTKPLEVETFVSLNAIMVDGTGMCGACRVSVGGETKFACFHGPDFDGHKVDFDQLTKRQRMFVAKEKIALEAVEN